jgi:hypothetical protein
MHKSIIKLDQNHFMIFYTKIEINRFLLEKLIFCEFNYFELFRE